MQYPLTEEQQLIQNTAREFADGELAPVAQAHNRSGEYPAEIIRKLSELGFLAMTSPADYGGTGAGNFALVLVLEELNRVCASTGITVSVHNSLATSPIVRFGSEELKQRYLPRLATGELIGAYCLTEAGSGSDAAALVTSAVEDGDHYLLNGSKMFVTTGKEAGLYICMSRTDVSHKTRGITAFVLERGYEGLRIGKVENKMGLRASSTTEIVLENCRVPRENIIGELGLGFKIAMDTLDGGRIGVAAQAIGIAQACLDASLEYAAERVQFGKPLSDFQAIQWKLADMATEIEAARHLTYNAARLRDEKKPVAKEASMAKLFASRLSNRAARDAVQIHGGAGYTTDFPVERFFRDARITELYEGTTEIQRLVISRALLRDYQ